MSRKIIFEFLEALTRNNSKEWMDKNRSWYEEAKSEVIDLFDPILEEIKRVDPRIVQENARRSLGRINNNLMFHPDRPTYKDHFGLGFGFGKGLADFYVGLGVNEVEVAGGLWHPPTEKVKKIRQEIDYEGARLQQILEEPSFKGNFDLYTRDSLKTVPKGYSKDHEHAHLLRLKSFAVLKPLSRKDVYAKGFGDRVVTSYLAVLPLLDFINEAIADDF